MYLYNEAHRYQRIQQSALGRKPIADRLYIQILRALNVCTYPLILFHIPQLGKKSGIGGNGLLAWLAGDQSASSVTKALIEKRAMFTSIIPEPN